MYSSAPWRLDDDKCATDTFYDAGDVAVAKEALLHHRLLMRAHRDGTNHFYSPTFTISSTAWRTHLLTVGCMTSRLASSPTAAWKLPVAKKRSAHTTCCLSTDSALIRTLPSSLTSCCTAAQQFPSLFETGDERARSASPMHPHAPS